MSDPATKGFVKGIVEANIETIKELKAENERLRKAIEEAIKEISSNESSLYFSDSEYRTWDILKNALAGKEGE